MSHSGLGTREYYEECVAKTVRTVKRAARKRIKQEPKSGANSKSGKTPEPAQMRQSVAEPASETIAPPPAKSVKIRLVLFQTFS